MENPFVEQRKAMKRLLFDMMRRKIEMTEDKIIAIFCLKTGIREKTAREYLKELKDSGVLEQIEEEKQKTLN